jgi:hypothetical protein
MRGKARIMNLCNHGMCIQELCNFQSRLSKQKKASSAHGGKACREKPMLHHQFQFEFPVAKATTPFPFIKQQEKREKIKHRK